MMRVIKREIRQNLSIHHKIRNASFVSLESQETQKFKYNLVFIVSEYIKSKFIAFKNNCNKLIQRLRLWLTGVDFKTMNSHTSLWLLEALIEGFILNYIVWSLMGWKFNFITLIGWGFATKQFLGIYWRLKKEDGSLATILTKNK